MVINNWWKVDIICDIFICCCKRNDGQPDNMNKWVFTANCFSMMISFGRNEWVCVNAQRPAGNFKVNWINFLLFFRTAFLIKCKATFDQAAAAAKEKESERKSSPKLEGGDQISKAIHLMESNGSKEMEHKTYVQCLPGNSNVDVAHTHTQDRSTFIVHVCGSRQQLSANALNI